MRNRFALFCTLVLMALMLSGCSATRKIRKADLKFENGAYHAAAEEYKKAKKKLKPRQKPILAEVNFKIGECYRHTANWSKASRAYNSAIKDKYAEPILYLNAAQCLHAQGNYEGAINLYSLYLETDAKNALALQGLQSAQTSAELLASRTRYLVRSANYLNSRSNSDFSATFVGTDTNTIVFTTNRALPKVKTNKRDVSQVTGAAHFNLFTTKRNKSGKWEKPSPLEGDFNTTGDEGASCFSVDGKTMFLTRCAGGSRAAEILRSERSGGEWKEPVPQQLFTDSTITVAHPALSVSGDTLFFVSDAPKGFGGKDIWMAIKLSDGKWGIPENLGEGVNTAGDEMFPTIHPDGSLYFSSNGHEGLGGLDIFKAVRTKSGQWVIANLQAPINSYADDFCIHFDSDRDAGYFSSSRGQKRAVDRIYRFEMPDLIFVLKGKVVDERGHALPDAIVKLIGNDGTNIKLHTKRDGTFQVKLNKNASYVMLGTCRGFLNSSENVSTVGLEENQTFQKTFKLPSVNKSIKMDHIYYEFAKWNLTKESEEELNGLVKLMKDNPHITIEISAHTDSVGSDQSNMILSQKRAQSVVNYLIKAGIESDRLTPVGYGESKPVVVDAETAKEYKFLKAGDVLTPEFIDELEADEQQIANQMNRRTEFRVLRTTYNLY